MVLEVKKKAFFVVRENVMCFFVVAMISIEDDAFRQSDNLLKVIFAHYAKLRNKQSTSCFSNVLKPALFDKNSLAGGS